MDEKMIANIDKIEKFYTGQYSKLEKLWIDMENNVLSNAEVSKAFYKYRNEELELTTLINETIRYKPRKIVLTAKQHSDDYFRRVFNT